MYSFPYLEPVCFSRSSSNCCFLTCIQISQEAGQVVCIPISLRIFHSLLWSTQSKALAEDIKKRWQEYTEELYKKDLHDLDNHNGGITHLEPDILECEVKWALRTITMNKAIGIPVELFQILENDAVKVLHSVCQQIWKTQQCPQFLSQRKAMPKSIQTTAQLHSSHTLAK